MTIKNLLLILVLSTVVISCKDGEAKKVADEPVETFKVGLDLVIQKDDSLQLFYKEASADDWKSFNSVTNAVKGSPTAQQVLFNLPENVLPAEIRLDFGTNKNQGPIEIKNFRMDYTGKTFQAKDTMFYQYFMPNDQIDYDRKTAVAKPINKSGAAYDPLFLPREVLIAEIEKLVK